MKLLVATSAPYYPITSRIIEPLLIQQEIKYEMVGRNDSGGLEELRPLQAVAQMRQDAPEYVFLIQDTCLPQPGFKEFMARVLAEAEKFNYDLVGLRSDIMPCHIGLYRSDFILRNISKIMEYGSLTKREKVMREIQGWMPSMAKSYGYFHGPDEWLGQIDLYGTGEPRWLRHFPEASLYKTTKHRSFDEMAPEQKESRI